MPVIDNRNRPEIILVAYGNRPGVQRRMDSRVIPVRRIADRCSVHTLSQRERHALICFLHRNDGRFRHPVIAFLLVQARVVVGQTMCEILVFASGFLRPAHLGQCQKTREGEVFHIIFRPVLVKRNNLLQDSPVYELIRP